MTKTKYAKAQAAKQRSLAEANSRSEQQRKLSLEVHRRLRAIDELANAVRIPIFKDWVNAEFREERAAKRNAFRIWRKAQAQKTIPIPKEVLTK